MDEKKGALPVRIVEGNVVTAGFNDYDIIELDLSTERTDELIASNVVSFTILSVDSGATAQLKLISTDKDPFTIPDDLDVGDSVSSAIPFDMYLTNTAQSGLTIKLVVFKRT